jgi:DNA-directed RNA polymerase I, II, and III subunit RPABC2
MSQENEDDIDLSENESEDDDEEESYQPPIKIEKSVNNIELELDDIDAELDESDTDADDADADEDDEDEDDEKSQNGEFDSDIDYAGIKSDAKLPFSEFDRLDEDDDDEDDDDEENGEAYLQKLDSALQQQIISDFHPELKSHNNNEIDILCRVVRDENGVIIDPLHKTIPFITRYEKARILGERAKQLNSGAKPLVDIEPSIIDGYLIALKEYEQKRIPFIIKRPIPNGGIEYWRFEDLEMLD